MESKDRKAALARIKQLKKDFKDDVNRRAGLLSFAYHIKDMNTLEEKFTSCSVEVEKLIKEHSLDENIFLKFKRDLVEILYDGAMKRKKYSWAASFAKKQTLK